MSGSLRTALMAVIVVSMTLILGAIGFTQINKTKRQTNEASDSIMRMAEESLNEVNELNGQTISGSRVTDYINSWYSSDQKLMVTTSMGGTYLYSDEMHTTKVDKATDEGALTYAGMNDKTSATYISPNAKFKVLVSYNENGDATVVNFERQ